jgi:hypothetical protein
MALSTPAELVESVSKLLTRDSTFSKTVSQNFHLSVPSQNPLGRALTIPEGECTTPYNAESYGGDDFANWAATVTTNGDRCDDSTAIKTGLEFFLDNYGCTDDVTTREAKRWKKIIGKINNYCN